MESVLDIAAQSTHAGDSKVDVGTGAAVRPEPQGNPHVLAIAGALGFLGFGNMGTAIAKGLVKSATIPASQLYAFDVKTESAKGIEQIGGTQVESAADLARRSQTLILAPKPQDMEVALNSVAGQLDDNALVISIAAGVSISFIQGVLGEDRHVARVMPNLSALVEAGAAGIALSASCSKEDGDVTKAIFESIGIAEQVPEESLDAVTALSGSGPAYYFALVEACVEAGVSLGLREDQATRLAEQTLYGAGLTLKRSGESAATLRERVTSKGGTTAAALACFEERDLKGTVHAAMEAAAARSEELRQ